VEGMFGPPLEMFSQGGTAITTTVTGTDEYMVHGQNSLMVEPYNLRQIVQFLRLLGTQPAYLKHLRTNALATAKAFTDWENSTRQVALGLEALHAEGWTNAHLRPALAALSTMHGHWLDEVWRGERGHSSLHPYVGPGEQVLLERYRQLKQSRPVRALQRLVSDDLKKSLRARLTRVLS
jgi:O-antigen biosynthesis protein